MTSASNRLYHGECNHNPLEALQAIQAELCQEATQMERASVGQPADQTDLALAEKWRNESAAVGRLIDEYSEELKHFNIRFSSRAQQIMTGFDMNNCIMQSFIDGAWDRCAI